MQIFTFFYHVRRMIGIGEDKKFDNLLLSGISESHNPSDETIKNIMAFSNAYRQEKSDAIGYLEYLIN